MKLLLRVISGATVMAAMMVAVGARTSLLSAEPYKDILDDPNFRPKPEVIPNKTIDQLITDAYGGLPIYMSDNFLDLTGDITTELDMVLTSEQFKAMYMKDESEDEGRYKRKATRPLVRRWPGQTIPYEFVLSHFNQDEVYYIKAAMAKWEEHTCLKFRPHRGSRENRIRFQNGNGCNSLLGMAKIGAQPINLQSPGCRYSGLYLHEVGHAIGLVHEHQLPDRDSYIYIIYDNVAPSMRIWFNKYSNKDVNQYGVPFEYSSVMHYGITAFSKDGSAQTIRAKDKSREAEIGRVYLKGLSFSDIKVVNLMYECNKHCGRDASCVEPAYLDKNCECVKPGDGDTTTTTPTGGCSNGWGDGKCNGWAGSGECDANPVWMKENCKKACKACDDSGDGTTDPEKCRNVWGDGKCDGWADTGECEANPIWMKENCKKSCKGCTETDGEGDGDGDGGGGTTTTQCTDDNQYCSDWAASGYCTTNWYTETNCKKSCDTCKASLHDESRTEDTDGSHSGAQTMMSQFMALLTTLTFAWSLM
ncbi:zinc metalloproteinase nas-13-like [Littorina saxatilis]|uniref:Metalloendopeptidase n=1 Tax=Littorina saxatilis TaxID=31220 RepID=A0AAN9APB2_9CAEN